MPEVTIVSTDPVEAKPTPGIGGAGNPILNFAAGSHGFGREYGSCYVGGVNEGARAVFVTAGQASTPPNSLTNYTHTLVLSDTDLHDGGSISESGPAPGPTVSTFTGVIAFP